MVFAGAPARRLWSALAPVRVLGGAGFLAGILIQDPRIPAVPGNRVVCRDGVPVAAFENGQTRILAQVEVGELPLVNRLFDIRPPEIFAK